MKLVVQVPCLNEEETLPLVLESIPRNIQGVDEIVVVVIDDGCTDRTVEVARAHGVRHFVRHVGTKGSPARSRTVWRTRWSSARTSWSTPTVTTSTPRSASPIS